MSTTEQNKGQESASGIRFRGRPSKIKELDPNLLEKMWRQYRNHKHIGDLLGMTRDSVRRAMNWHGIYQRCADLDDIKPIQLAYERGDHSPMSFWLRANPGKKLPKDVRQIAQITESSLDSVRCYLYRQRQRVMNMLEELPDLRDLHLPLVDVVGKTWESGQFLKYKYIVSYWSAVSIEAIIDEKLMTEVPIEIALFQVPNLDNFLQVCAQAFRSLPQEDQVRLIQNRREQTGEVPPQKKSRGSKGRRTSQVRHG